jgi:tRNA-modifying protein YgfZ
VGASVPPVDPELQVFVTATGRIVDWAHLLVQKEGVIALMSPNSADPVMNRLQKYIFPKDNVQLDSISDQTRY